MARKYLRITEVVKVCGVDQEFINQLERESLIRPTVRQRQKLYSLDQVIVFAWPACSLKKWG